MHKNLSSSLCMKLVNMLISRCLWVALLGLVLWRHLDCKLLFRELCSYLFTYLLRIFTPQLIFHATYLSLAFSPMNGLNCRSISKRQYYRLVFVLVCTLKVCTLSGEHTSEPSLLCCMMFHTLDSFVPPRFTEIWLTALCKFQAYNEIWYKNMLWNAYQNKGS